MCGIAGISFFDGRDVSPELIANMTSSLTHRGPDGQGARLFGATALGHRRLSIIDLATGSQPMANEDGSIWITFNGEIYNFVELRSVLESAGHHFTTRSDTEVIIHGYEEWGSEIVTKLRGMFAFAIFDSRKNQLFLARDHFGIKPLYYLEDPKVFAFASELQAFWPLPVRLDVNLDAVDQFLWFQYIPAPLTIFRNVQKLPPACHLTVHLEDGHKVLKKYWEPAFSPDDSKTEEQWLEELDHALDDSVRAHMISDVPLGVFLSGGVDSSAVLAYMAGHHTGPVRAFSIGFEEKEYNEIEYSERAAKRWGAEHHVEIVKPDALAILPALVRHYGEPFGDSSAVPTYYVSRLARKHVPLVLSGDGGDELFAGYPSYQGWLNRLENYRVARRSTLNRAIKRLFPEYHLSQARQNITLDDWLGIISYINVDQRRMLWRQEHQQALQYSVDVFAQAFERTRSNHYSNANVVQYLDINTYLPFDILAKVDVASMMHGLEVRPPFIDVKVFELAASIPERFNIRKEAGEWSGKSLLKKVMSKYYPEDFLNRPKMGFGVPVQKWMAAGGALHEYVQDTILHPHANITEYFDSQAISRIVQENSYGRIWLLVFLEEWLRQFKGRFADRQ